MSDVFKTLNAINVNGNVEQKNGSNYLSWAWAWAELKKVYPTAKYEIKHFDGKPYLYDANLGYMVMTEMTVDGITHEMWLPVMDGANKAMKDKPYTYEVKEYVKGKWTGNYIEKKVNVATMFDINTAIMRCLVKNIAMFGLGLYIYSGEDLPEEEKKAEEEERKAAEEKKAEERKKAQEEAKRKAEEKKQAEMKIDAEKVKDIKERCQKDNVPEEKVLKLCNINTLEEMKVKVYKNIVANWDKVKDTAE